MNIIKRRSTVKNSRKEEYDIPQHLDLLNKWTIPKISPRIIYQMGTFEKLGLKQVVKTTEETITIDSENQTFRLLSDNDLAPYKDIYRFMHIGLVQVAFKPLTLRGLPESFIAALRDGRNQNWKKSLIGTIQTSLAYGPVYFNAYPNLQISLQDENSLSSLMLNVKLHGYDYMPGTEVVCVCYRIYYKLLHTLNPMCKVIDFKNETILIETNFDKSKVVTRRPIKWEEIDFSQEWVIENATQPQNNINTEVSEIEQLNDGTVKIRFHEPINMLTDNRIMSSRISRSNSSYISPVDYIVQVPSRASTSQIRETYRCDNIKIDRDNIVKPIRRTSSDLDITESEMNFPDGITGKEKVTHSSLQPPPDIDDFKIKDYSDLESFLEKKFKGSGVQPIDTDNFIEGEPSNKKDFYDSLNKISEKYARKPVQRMFYYPRPTPQDVLLEEHEHIITNSYNGKEIYEWNIDGYTDRKIFTTVHRMLMYSTICKTNKNSDKTIADMITAGFTGQLKGWWDNYLNQTQRDTVLMAVKQERDQVTQNAVYTLVLNIIEHFSGRWSDNSETIRTLLQNLRCKSLTSFRVRKSLRGDDHSINYDNYTYGKLISDCVQEGLSLCNEIKLNQQIKRHRLTERKQLGEFCEQFAFDIPKQKSQDVEVSHKKKKSSKKDYEKWKKKKIEKKLRRAEEGRGDFSKRKKKYRQNFNRSDTCHKCGRYGHYAKDCRVKEKIKNLDIDDNLKDSLYKIMLNSDTESGTEYSSEESSRSEDLKALQQEEFLTSEDECSSCQQGMACEKDEGDDLYKIYEQFKELSLNVIDNDKVIELLQNIKDPEIRAQIIDKISDSREKDHITEKNYIPKEIPTKEGSYTMAEVKNLLLERRKRTSSPTMISDLKEEINNLKEDIIRLKEKNVVIE
ncbi:hypothetical protein H5410_022710, partial [Solanum commersonii]